MAATAILAATVTQAQPEPKDGDVISRIMTARQAGDYLRVSDILRPLAWTDDAKVRDEALWSRWQETEGLITGEPPIHPPGDRTAAQTPEDRVLISRIEHAAPKDALAEIVARARHTRIVILNEYHTVPRSRAFALQVARALRPLGYDVLAAETFSNDADPQRYAKLMAQLTTDGDVRRNTGFYSQDPVFAAFVREALVLGYRPVAYETTDFKPRPTIASGHGSRPRPII